MATDTDKKTSEATPEQAQAIALMLAKQEDARRRIADLRARSPHVTLQIDETMLSATPTPGNLSSIDNAIAAINTQVTNAETSVLSDMIDAVAEGAKALWSKAGSMLGSKPHTANTFSAPPPVDHKTLLARANIKPGLLSGGFAPDPNKKIIDQIQRNITGGDEVFGDSLNAFANMQPPPIPEALQPDITPANFTTATDPTKRKL